MLDIHEPTKEDREGIALVAGLSFNFAMSPDIVTLPGPLCAFDNGRVIGTARAIPFDQWFGGARVPCAGIAGVAVLPEYRGRGVAAAIMWQLLERRRSQGEVVSALFPANSQLYRQLGYEFAGLRPEFRAPVTDLPVSKVGVREMAVGEMAQVMACYSRYAAAHNGPVESSAPAHWADHILAHQGEGTHQRTVVVPGDGGLDGYASYFVDRWENDGYSVHCKHLVALTSPALLGLLGHFRRFENAARELVWRGPPSTAPVGLALGSTAFTITPGLRRWMLRLLDVPRALEARGYPGQSGEVVIAVDDPLFPENAGPWLLQVANGRAQVGPAPSGPGAGEPARPGAKPLPAGLLAALYAGLATPADLVLMGAIDASDPRLPTLSALFAGPVPWMPDFF